MTPIEKNIIVVDENGNQYEATYPKRAKGLVKTGRARFINENTICLACPPKNESEDRIMSENKKVVNLNANGTETSFDTTEQTPESKLTAEYLLMKIEELSVNQAVLTDAVTELGKLKSIGPGDVGMQEQARALGTIIKSREATNQKLIALYEKMYDDIITKDLSLKERAIRLLEKVCE
ncbi:MAG: hypothetical protein IKL41_06040, partial [Clostridia bacterium]|nr:hypothetical protein [Clostridia bacterium]